MHIANFLLFLAGLSCVLSTPATKRTRTVSVTTTTTRTTSTPTNVQTTTITLEQARIRSTKSRRKSGQTRTTTTTSTTTTSVPTPTKSTGKRGLAFNDPALTGYFSLSGQGSKVTWAYNWASDPYYPAGWTPNSYNGVLTYTPMLWSNAEALTNIWNANVRNAVRKYGTDSVLAFNEPDGCCWSCGNSCMNVSVAVSAYRQWVQPWAGKVRLGAPAVTNGVGDGIGISYLTQFLGNCTRCTVDFIPIHWYGSVLDPDSFKTYVQSFWTKFRKPVWITEFAPTSGTDDQIIQFLQNVLPWLDRQTYVQRYSYFMDRAAGSPYLLETNNTLTDIGVVFNSS